MALGAMGCTERDSYRDWRRVNAAATAAISKKTSEEGSGTLDDKSDPEPDAGAPKFDRHKLYWSAPMGNPVLSLGKMPAG